MTYEVMVVNPMLVLPGWSVCFTLGCITVFVDALLIIFQYLSTRCDKTMQSPVSRACYGVIETHNSVAHRRWHLILIFPKRHIIHPTSTFIYEVCVEQYVIFEQFLR